MGYILPPINIHKERKGGTCKMDGNSCACERKKEMENKCITFNKTAKKLNTL